MELKIIMADPAGNRTAIVRTPVPAGLRAKTASEIMKIEELRAEQVGFETVPQTGGAGRLEMMGGEFCGNAARSYGFLLFSERDGIITDSAAASAEKADVTEESAMASAEKADVTEESAVASAEKADVTEESAVASAENSAVSKESASVSPGSHVPANPDGDILIEISGNTGLLRVNCDPEKGIAFSEMPMPLRLERTEEGFPLVISEGIAHVIFEDMEPDPGLIHRMTERYGREFDAFGMQFLKGDSLIPVVYVDASQSLVYESSCGSGSLAAAWYLQRAAERNGRPEPGKDPGVSERYPEPGKNPGTMVKCPEPGKDPGTLERRPEPGKDPGTMVKCPLSGNKSGVRGKESGVYRFREPGGEIFVQLFRDGQGVMHGSMGGRISLEKEVLLTI